MCCIIRNWASTNLPCIWLDSKAFEVFWCFEQTQNLGWSKHGYSIMHGLGFKICRNLLHIHLVMSSFDSHLLCWLFTKYSHCITHTHLRMDWTRGMLDCIVCTFQWSVAVHFIVVYIFTIIECIPLLLLNCMFTYKHESRHWEKGSIFIKNRCRF